VDVLSKHALRDVCQINDSCPAMNSDKNEHSPCRRHRPFGAGLVNVFYSVVVSGNTNASFKAHTRFTLFVVPDTINIIVPTFVARLATTEKDYTNNRVGFLLATSKPLA
jgi:hypothetical protein